LKEKLGGEEGPLETLTFEQLLTQFKSDIDSLAQNETLMFDGFPYEVR
jgi:hypothetical protein